MIIESELYNWRTGLELSRRWKGKRRARENVRGTGYQAVLVFSAKTKHRHPRDKCISSIRGWRGPEGHKVIILIDNMTQWALLGNENCQDVSRYKPGCQQI